MNIKFGSIIAVMIALSGSSSVGQGTNWWDVSNCKPPAGFTSVSKRSELASPIKEKLNDVAMLGEDWNSTDDIDPTLPLSGALFIWHHGQTWILDIGHGGIAETFRMVAFEVSEDGNKATSNTISRFTGSSLCEEAKHYALSNSRRAR